MEKHIKRWILPGSTLLIMLNIILISSLPSCEEKVKTYKVERGYFEAKLSYKGEISGLNSTKIRAPKVLSDRDLRLWDMKIVNLIEDGKSVKKGDFIVQLDGSKINETMRQERQNLEREMANLSNAKIDSTVQLTQLREDITNALLDLEYQKIDLEQSVYESEAYQRKVQMAYQKAENNIAKKKREYLLQKNKLKTHVARAEKRVDRITAKMDKLKLALQSTRIMAPSDGILIFGSGWDGKKYTKDSRVVTFEFGPPIAMLPDMSSVVSEIYVKEIDIAKMQVGDTVNVSFDAVEDLELKGNIKEIARMGEDHNDFDMKVFKVFVSLDKSDERLKPAMSSNNDIVLSKSDTSLFVPVNSVFNNNGRSYVYLKTNEGVVKQTIEPGYQNEEFMEVFSGIKEGDKILLEAPVVNEKTAEL